MQKSIPNFKNFVLTFIYYLTIIPINFAKPSN